MDNITSSNGEIKPLETTTLDNDDNPDNPCTSIEEEKHTPIENTNSSDDNNKATELLDSPTMPPLVASTNSASLNAPVVTIMELDEHIVAEDDTFPSSLGTSLSSENINQDVSTITKDTPTLSPSSTSSDVPVITTTALNTMSKSTNVGYKDNIVAISDGEDSSDDEIDDNLEIVVEGEEEDESNEENPMDTDERREEDCHSVPPELTKALSDPEVVKVSTVSKMTSINNVSQESQTNSTTPLVSTDTRPMSVVMATSSSSTTSVTSATSTVTTDKVATRNRSKECAKVKQFFTTLQTFANNVSRDVAEQVQELITALVNGLATVEEFHQEIQMVTNYPLKDFVIPFLKENLVYFQEELKVTAEALSSILGSAPNPETPVTAPEYVEPELVIVPSTKPSAPPTTTTVTSAPSSPLSILSNDRNLSNLPSMSAPPATIHEPPAIAPTRIETVPNASAVRKRPRDLFMDGNDTGHEGRGHSQGYGPKRPRPIPTATLTPTQGQLHHQQQPPPQQQQQQQQQPPPPPHINDPRPSHIYSQSHSTSYVPVSRAVTATTHVQYSHSRPSSAGSTGTPQREISPVIVTSTSSNPLVHQRMLTQIKDDWAHLETMMMTIEGMVSKSQKSFQTLKERVQQVVTMTSSLQYRQFELEHEQVVQQRIEQALDEANLQAAEEKQKILVDASRQMRDAIREANVQTNSKESCWNCGRKATETCSGCNKARYCGTFCQHKDWDKHMKQCAGSRSNREKERTMTVSHATRTTPLNHASTNTPTVNSHHHIPNSHSHITMATPSSRIIKSNRAPTPTSYIGSELFVPLRTDPLANGNGTLTATSNGVAVVTISRTPGDMTTTGGTLI